MVTDKIKLNNIRKVYYTGNKPRTVIDNLSLTIKENERVAIMGSSGSGKTTLLKIIGLQIPADLGAYNLEGNSIERITEEGKYNILRNQIGYVDQYYNLISSLTAYQNIELGYSISGQRVDDSYIKSLVDMMNVTSILDLYPHQLSGGQCQKISIIRALCKSPKLLLMDEPTANLDYLSREEIIKIVSKLEDNTQVIVTHDSYIACHLDRVILISDGKLFAQIVRICGESNNKFQERIELATVKGG